jgi:hypothetical protein
MDEQYMKFDSELFGLRVASVTFNTDSSKSISESDLLESLNSMSGASDLIFDTGHSIDRLELEEIGCILMDVKTTYSVSLETFDSIDLPAMIDGASTNQTCIRVKSYPKSEPTGYVLDLAHAAGIHSRFAKDPNLGQQSRFQAMYKEWCVIRCQRKIASEVFVACVDGPDHEQQVGLITAGTKKMEDGRQCANTLPARPVPKVETEGTISLLST